MARSELELKASAARAYETGRVLFAARPLLFIAPVTALATLSCEHAVYAFITGGLLAALCILLLWRGGKFGRSVWPGLFAGALPFLLPIAVRTVAHLCSPEACVIGGLAGGIGLGVLLARRSDVSLLAAAGVAAVTGSLGCILLGVAGLAGMAVGLVLGAAPVVAFRRASA